MTALTYFETRWQCRGCGKFVAESTVHSRDYLDNGAYYGVSSEMWCDCPRCGRTAEPACVPTREREVPQS